MIYDETCTDPSPFGDSPGWVNKEPMRPWTALLQSKPAFRQTENW